MANKYLNFDGLSHLIDKLKASIAKKVDKVEGKTLSTNDYTTAEKNKLAGIAEGANNYTLPSAGTSLGGVKSGGDVTISGGVITVNDDSHNHKIENVDGLQNALDGKSDDGHGHEIADVSGLQKALDGKEASGAAATALTNAKSYTNGEIETVTELLEEGLETKANASDLTSHTSNKSNPHGVTAAQVGADPKGTAASAVSSHNTSTTAHGDIRDLIEELTTRLNALADSDDTTLDQMSEIVAYIKSNKSLIDSITTSKVNVSDIVNNLTTNVSNKPLSAAQGVALKALIDAINTSLATKGSGDMLKSVYDTDGDGIVDNAEKVNGFTVGVNVPANAKFTDTVYTHPSYTAKSSGLYKVTVDGTGHVSGTAAVAKSDITALGIPAQDTTYSVATTSANGLMSSTDKSKLDGIASGANKYTHPTYTARTGKPTANATPAFGGTFTVSQITSDGTGHVTGATDRTITIPSTAATTSAAGLMSASDKSKLDGIASGANKITVDSSLSSSSTNPVQNKVVNTALSTKLPLSGGTVTGGLTVASTNSADTNGLFVCRSGSIGSEYVRHYVDDQSYHMVYTNDEVSNKVSFEMTANDSENSDGTNASTSNVTFTNSGNKSTVTANTFVGSLSGNATTASSAAKLTGLTASRALVSDSSGNATVSAVTSTELGYLDGVTSNVQTQLNAKQATISGGASTIASSNLTASRALVSNSSGKVAVSAVTSTELGYLDGVTSNVQTQLNTKVNCTNVTTADLNTLTTSGFYQLSGTNDNMPSGCAWGQLLTMHGGGDTITQIIGSYSTGKLYTRGGNPTGVGGDGTWTAWQELATQTTINTLITRIAALEAAIGFSTNESDM